ncbi:MAG: NGG1p interacting factor NIF3 [Actinomycetota bacterium]|nr:NGG1p interacting factor NIF3 [Actinomycetota bacterium]
MKIKEIYDLALKMGMEADPRGKDEIDRLLSKAKKNFKKMEEGERAIFDQESLTNPYSDTRILFGDAQAEVKKLICGIDIEVGEVVLTDRLNEKGEGIDLLLAHHPEGRALAGLSEVMKMQADIWHREGVPINVADFLIDKRMKEVARSLMPVNHNRAIDAAKLLGIPFMNIHTPSDNMVTAYLQKGLDEAKPYTVKDVVDFLKNIDEYKEAARMGAGPTILIGDGDKRAGRVVVDMTGGTEGPEDIYEKLADAGVGTVVGMHMSDKLKKKAEKHHVNVVIAGHIASDNLGLNLILDEIEKRGVEVLACSGLVRVKRK